MLGRCGIRAPIPRRCERSAENTVCKEATMNHVSRRTFVRGAVALSTVPGLMLTRRPAHAQSGRGKPFAGKTLNVFTFDHPYSRALKTLLPQFAETTGIKVEVD